MDLSHSAADTRMAEIGVHKMLETLVSKVVEKSMTYKSKVIEAKKLVDAIEDHSRHLSDPKEFVDLLTELTESGYELLNQMDMSWKIAGIVVLDCLLDLEDDMQIVTSTAVMNTRRINIANSLRDKVLENHKIGLEAGNFVLREAALSIGHLARIATPAELEHLEKVYYPVAMRKLSTQRSDFDQLGGCLIVKELSTNAPTMVFSKKKPIFHALTSAVCGKSHIVREAAAEALKAILLLVSQREGMVEWISSSLKIVDDGLASERSEVIIGVLLILDIIIGGVVVPVQELNQIMKTLNRAVHVIIFNVLALRKSTDGDVRRKVINIVPRLASAFSGTFTIPNQYTNPLNFLHYTVNYLVELIRAKQRMRGDMERPLAYIAVGKVCHIMNAALRPGNALVANPVVSKIIDTVREGFSRDDFFCIQAMYCLGSIVNAIPSSRGLLDTSLLNSMFWGGLTIDLVDNLKIIIKHIPSKKVYVQRQLLAHTQSILQGYDVTLYRGPRSARISAGDGLSGLLSDTNKKKRSSSIKAVIDKRGGSQAEDGGVGGAFGDDNDGGLLSEGGNLDRFLQKSRFGVRSTIRKGLGIGKLGSRNKGGDSDGQYNNNYTAVSNSDTMDIDGGSIYFNEANLGGDVGSSSAAYTDSELILALHVLASPDFFCGDDTKTAINSKSKTLRGGGLEEAGSKEFKNSDKEKELAKSPTNPSSPSSDNSQDNIDNSMLLLVLRDAVIRYLDDNNANIRKAAVDTCASILDTVVASIELTSPAYNVFTLVLNRLLMLGVGDDLEDIRREVFHALPSSLDKHVGEAENLHCVLRAVNDEAFGVRVAALSVLSRVAHYDALHILPEIRLILNGLLIQIQNSTNVIGDVQASADETRKSTRVSSDLGDTSRASALMNSNDLSMGLSKELYGLRLLSVRTLQALVESAKGTLAPYVEQILDVLVPLLHDKVPDVARSALSSIGELSLAAPESIQSLLPGLLPLIITSLKDEKNAEGQNTALEALGKLIESLSNFMVEPYLRYPGLFEGLVSIIQSTRSTQELRLKATRMVGLLGSVNVDTYNEQMNTVKAKEKEKSSGIDEDPMEKTSDGIVADASEELEEGADGEKDDVKNDNVELIEDGSRKSDTEMYYFHVIIHKLIIILRDSSLYSHHLSASQVAVRIVAIVGPQAQSSVGALVDAFAYRLYNTEIGNNLRDALLAQMMTIIHVIGRGMRPHLKSVVRLINYFFDESPRQCMDLLESVGLKVLLPDFNIVLRGVLPTLLKVLREEPFEVTTQLDRNKVHASSVTGHGAVPEGKANSAGDKTILPKTQRILQTLNNICEIVGDQKRVIIPALAQVLDNPHPALWVDRKSVLVTLLHLTNDVHLQRLASYIILPAMRVINGTTATLTSRQSLPLLRTTLTALSCMACRLGKGFVPYIIPVRRNINIMISALTGESVSLILGISGVSGSNLNFGSHGGAPGADRRNQSDSGNDYYSSTSGGNNSPMTMEKLKEILPQLREYETIVGQLLSDKPLPMEPSDAKTVAPYVDPRVRNRAMTARDLDAHVQPPSLHSLEQAWVLAGRNSASDLAEWMHRLTSELIRQSPSPVIRTCSGLSKAYPPLAQELLSVCFACIWDKLFLAYSNDLVDNNSLVQGMELALKSPHISSHMTNSLLQLAEFMDMKDKRLPLDVTLLARCAENANMYAKALRYRELQFNSVNIVPTGECIESSITVNNQLGSEDRAIGVLEHVITNFTHISVEPLWLEKLKQWSSAKHLYAQTISDCLESYPDDPPTRHRKWLSSEMGLLRCMHALGEFKALAESAENLKNHLNADLNNSVVTGTDYEKHLVVLAEVKRLGANASWNLGQWEQMSNFLGNNPSSHGLGVTTTAGGYISAQLHSSNDPSLDWVGASPSVVDATQEVSFYHAVLAIHRGDYSRAQQLIESTRATLVPTISSVLNEGYTRAYRAMISMQVMAELEEVIQFKITAAEITSKASQADNSSGDGMNSNDSVQYISSGSAWSLPSNTGKDERKASTRGGMSRSNSRKVGADLYVPRNYGVEKSDDTVTSNSALAQKKVKEEREKLMSKWRQRLKQVPMDVDSYRQVLAVHTLIAEPTEDIESWLQLVKLSRKEQMFSLCESLLLRLGAPLELAMQREEVKKSGALIDFDDETGSASASGTSVTGMSKHSSAVNLTELQTRPPNTDDSLAHPEWPPGEEPQPRDKRGASGGAASNSTSIGKGSPSAGSSLAGLFPVASSRDNLKNSTSAPAFGSVTSLNGMKPKYSELSSTEEKIRYSAIKVLWHAGEKSRALNELSSFVNSVTHTQRDVKLKKTLSGRFGSFGGLDKLSKIIKIASVSKTPEDKSLEDDFSASSPASEWVPRLGSSAAEKSHVDFRVKCLLKRVEWMRELGEAPLSEVLECVMEARGIAADRYSVWHAWGVTNYDQVLSIGERSMKATDKLAERDITIPGSISEGSSSRDSGYESDFGLQVTDVKGGSRMTVTGKGDDCNIDSGNTSLNSLKSLNSRQRELLERAKHKKSAASIRPSPGGSSLVLGGTRGSLLKRSYTHKLTSSSATLGVSAQGHSSSGSDITHDVDTKSLEVSEREVTTYVVEAIKGFVRSIILGHGKALAHVLQDTLRLLTLWFNYGTLQGVYRITSAEIDQVAPDTWLSVLPQLIARMHFTSPEIYSVLQKLLTTVGVTHPQALVCPISVARNTMNKQQKAVASHVLNAIRKKQSQLVEEASMVSRELMRVAISPHELWKAGLDMAYTHYMNRDESIPRSVNVRNMLNTLTQMHDAMEHEEQDASCAATTGTSSMSMYTSRKQGDEGFTETSGKIGTVTLRDISFRHQYGRQLAEAKDLLDEFRKTGTTLVLHRLWNVYFSIIMRMDKSLATQSKVQLHHVSRDLTSSRGLRLCVPGTYVPNGPEVSIAKFVNTLSIISSKQRPRRMAMLGSDGRTYEFLLKGKEDLRQDERVMQLFGLINVCLDNNQGTNRQSLKIVQYSVLPLSNNSGVIGWLQNCDTLHALLSQYRSERNIPQLLETVLLRQKLDGGAYLKKYDRLPGLAKVEVFSSILEQTTGKDLEKMLWLKSGTADSWVGRRESFTRSMAVMSIVGYILGLGDRHMANIMLDRVSGRVIHIDFGDCFEVNKTRSVYPETVPFRLTRMLTNCMGSSGMTGTFKATSYRVMRVLHENRDSVMAMLEAFVYDPMVSWRVLANESTPANNPGGGAAGGDNNPAAVEIGEPGTTGLSETATNSKTLNASLNGQAVAKEFGAAEERAMQQSLSQAMSWSQSLFNRQRLSVSGYGGGVTGTTSSHAASAAQQGLADVDPLVDGLQASISHVMRESVGRRDSYLQMPSMRATDARGTSYGNSTLYETGESTPLTVSTGAVPSLPTLTMTPSQAPSMRGSQSGTDLATSAAAVLDVSADKNDDEAAPLQEDLNARAVEVINRIHSKLTGRDFATTDDDNDILTVEQQVDRLINEATSIENLCKLYFGWNPWW